MSQTQSPPPDLLNLPLGQLFPKRWLHHDHLLGRPRPAMTVQAAVEAVFDPKKKTNTFKNCLWFRNKAKGMLLKQTQTIALLRACRANTVARCLGHAIILTPTRHNDQKTTSISAMPANIEGEA